MKSYYLTLIFSLSLYSDIVRAQNRYDIPVEAPIINTYVPMSHKEMMLRAAAAVWKKRQTIGSFAECSRTAYFYLQKKQIGHFVNHTDVALSTGHYSIQLYYNLGISYYLLGQQRKGRKLLEKASKKGFTEANHALLTIKKKEALSYS